MERKILHCDLNNFYASVECLYRPDLAGVPVAVGGDADRRHGIVLAKNMPAKNCGVKTGETLWQARQKCAGLVVLPPDFEKYERFSRMAQDIYATYADRIQPFGIDECWLDVTGIRRGGNEIGHEIRLRIKEELGVTISVGVSFNKVFAKLGSDMKKPDAVTIIGKDDFREKVWPLPIGDLLYAGSATVRGLHAMGITTIGLLAASDEAVIAKRFGKVGLMLRRYAVGQDDEAVEVEGYRRDPKSIGNSVTTPKDLICREDVLLIATLMAEKVAARLRGAEMRAGGVCVSIRDADLRWEEYYGRLETPTACSGELVRAAMELFDAGWKFEGRPAIRALGVRAVHLLREAEAVQLDMEGREQREIRISGLEAGIDKLRERYGREAICRAVMLTRPDLVKTGRRLENPLPAPRKAR